MTMRQDETTEVWPLRPWIMAAICATAGLLFHLLTDHVYGEAVDRWRQAGATFVAIAALSFILTVEQRRWLWSLYFAIGWGAVIALVGWFTASYNQYPTIFERPFLSGVFAVLLAAPLFQTLRDEGAWNFPYPRLHSHAWTDAVIGAASLAFVGIAFLLAWLIAGLFDLIGIKLIKDLLRKDWFEWMLAGFAFGAALGLLRERDALVATLQRLVTVVLGVLAPVLAVSLVAFLVSVPFTGLGKLWDSVVPATPLMLVAGAGAILLANAVIGDGVDDKATNRVLRLAAPALVLTVLPLAIIAAVSLGQRIGQYGWTPERIWGVVAVGVAVVYGLAGWWAVVRGRVDFDDVLRPLQTRMAIAVCGVALLLALPILDFGAISASSQMDRLANGKVKPSEFDWKAMAFDFGPAGRKRLSEVKRGGSPELRMQAIGALAAKDRYQVEEQMLRSESAAKLSTHLRVIPQGTVLSPAMRTALAESLFCRTGPCIAVPLDDRRALVAGSGGDQRPIEVWTLILDDQGKRVPNDVSATPRRASVGPNLATATIEVRKVERRQLYIDGKPVGAEFE